MPAGFPHERRGPLRFKLEPTTIQGIRTEMMIPDPDTVNITRLVFEMYVEPSTSFEDIAWYFAQEGILVYLYCTKQTDNMNCEGCGTLRTAEFEQFVYKAMMQKSSEFQTLTAKGRGGQS